MKKLLLMSVLFATIGIPAVAAKDPNARRGLGKTVLYSVAFYVAYWLALMFVVGRLD
jgi:hypothetical protein